jgi:hypothetical protein
MREGANAHHRSRLVIMANNNNMMIGYTEKNKRVGGWTTGEE